MKILSVTDLSSYLYCPRKFYLEKVKGLRAPPTRPMIEGRLRHQILEEFSNNEQKLVESISTPDKNEIINIFSELLNELIQQSFLKNSNLMQKFSISSHELKKKICNSMRNDIILRADAIVRTIQKGFTGKRLWENLIPRYISELPLISEKLGLKGRADRVMIADEIILPFELKTREINKIYPSDEIQLTAYAMLLEEVYDKKIPVGILESGDIKHEIIITRELKQNVYNIINEIKNLFETGKAKFPSNFSKCQICSYEKQCSELE